MLLSFVDIGTKGHRDCKPSRLQAIETAKTPHLLKHKTPCLYAGSWVLRDDEPINTKTQQVVYPCWVLAFLHRPPLGEPRQSTVEKNPITSTAR